MKLQNLVIIFIIIIMPIVLIFSLYLNLETKTIIMQTDYDEKILESTKEAIQAFEINTTEWNNNYSSLANTKRQHLLSSINVLITSISDKIRIGGTSKENILNYIPAVVYTMYDGYYIYSPTYVPQSITNNNGVQLFYYENSGSDGAKITDSATQNIGGTIVDGKPIYECQSGTPITATYSGKTIEFTTNIEKSEKVYKHILKTFVPYSAIYHNSNNGKDYIINYTLDNYIRIYYGNMIKEGYVLDDNIIIPVNSINGIKVNDNVIEGEILTENVYVKEDNAAQAVLGKYQYIYNSNNDKRYWDSVNNKFFLINKNDVKVYLTYDNINPGDTRAEYKKVLVRKSNTSWDYIELYQTLNSTDEAWYYKQGNEYIKYNNFQNPNKNVDFSSINYYVKNAEFNQWMKSNRFDNNKILEQKRDSIIKNINDNLNLSISNYSANAQIDYKMPELTDNDWNQVLSNISMITFFQGKKIGLKTYNNYAIVTSTENNEYTSEESLYFISKDTEDEYYHRMKCDKRVGNIVEAYVNTDFKLKKYNDTYYYKHGEFEMCYDCIVNRNNYTEESSTNYNKVFYTALGRERFVQMSKSTLTIQ